MGFLRDIFSIKRKSRKVRRNKVSQISYKSYKTHPYNITPDTKNVKFAAPLWNLLKKLRTITEDRQYDSVGRITFSDLMKTILKDPIVIAGLHRYQTGIHEMISYERINIQNDDKFAKRFKDEIWPTNKSHFQHCFLEKSPYHFGIYGNVLIEMIKGKKKEDVVYDTQVMNIRQYDFYEENGKIKTMGGYPVGFVDENGWPEGMEKKEESDQPYYISDIDVMHLPFIQFHNTEWAYGFTELMYNMINRREDIADAQSVQDKRQGYPVPIITYGSSEYRPSFGMKKEAMTIAAELVDPETIAAMLPSYMSLRYMDDMTGNKASENLNDNIMTIIKQQAGILGIPIAALMMSMEGQPATGFSQISEFFEYNIKDMAKKLRIEKALQLWSGNPDLDVVIEYDEILAATAKEQIMNIHRLGKADMIPKNDPAFQKKLLEKLGFRDIEVFGQHVEEILELRKKLEANGGGDE